MPTEVKAYRANDGSIYDNECAAATRDVQLLVQASPLAENQPYAKKLVDWLTENSKQIRAVLETHERSCPKDAEQSSAPVGLEGTRERTRGYWTRSHALDQYTMKDVTPDEVQAIMLAAAKVDRESVKSFIKSLCVNDLAALLAQDRQVLKKAYAWAHNKFFIDEEDGA